MDINIALPPIHTLPPEILGEVFLRIYPQLEIGSRNLSTSPSLSIWSLAAVCSLWRAVIFSFPYLWSNICVYTHIFPRNPWKDSLTQRFAALLNTCFARSSNCAVSFSLLGYPAFGIPIQFLESAILSPLSSIMHRLSSISIEADLTYFIPLLECKLDKGRGLTSLPVRKLAFHGWQSISPDQTYNFSKTLSRLSSLKLVDVNDPLVHQWKFPWYQLTRFEWRAYPLPLELYIEVLKMMKSLEHLKVTTCCVAKFADIQISMEHLNTVTIKADVRSIRKLLGPLVAPSLRGLTISEYKLSGVDDPFHAVPLVDMIERSNCEIQSLDIRGFNQVDVRNSLQGFPRLLKCFEITSTANV